METEHFCMFLGQFVMRICSYQSYIATKNRHPVHLVLRKFSPVDMINLITVS